MEPGEARRYVVGLLAIWGITVAGLLAAAFLDEKPGDAASAERLEERIPRIAERVEKLRGLQFREIPESHVVSITDLRSESEEALSRPKAMRQVQEGEEVLKLLGLLAPEDEIADLAGSSANVVVGFYDPKEKEMALVRGAEPKNPGEVGITLAHELEHALEDQRLGITKGEEEDPISDDRASAQLALVEGSATAVEFEYVDRYLSAERQSEAIGASLLGGGGDVSELPGFVQVEASFRYGTGKDFVEHLYRLADGWKLVNLALGSRPPVSTEQIFHPRKYVLDERPIPVEIDAKPVLGSGWERVSDGSVGELDTLQLLLGAPSSEPESAAEGWGGGKYELWRRGEFDPADCPAPCRTRDALILAWRWDTLADAEEFGDGIREYIEDGLGGRIAGPDVWLFKGSPLGLYERGTATSLVFAPDRATARRLARGNPVSSPSSP